MPTMFDDWIGRTETMDETIHPTRLAAAAAMLGLGAEGARRLAEAGAPIPPLFHFFFANNLGDAGVLDSDGHEKLGAFMPPVHKAGHEAGHGAGAFNRRMWAAGAITFTGAMRTGEMLHRTSTIRAIEMKEGSSGPLIFVTIDRRLETAHGRVDEERVIVYRNTSPHEGDTPPHEGGTPRHKGGKPPHEGGTPHGRRTLDSRTHPGQDGLNEIARWRPDHIQLFRFSALTWNSHRIHYDADYCRTHEGYPDIVTHGPFTALMLAQVATGGIGTSEAGPGGIGPGAGRITAGGIGTGGGTPQGAGSQGVGVQGTRLEGVRKLRRFRFRAIQPLFVGRDVRLCASDDFTRLEARNHRDQQAMTAEATFA